MIISQIRGRDWASVSGGLEDAVEAIQSRWALRGEASPYEVLESGKRVAIVQPAADPRHPWAAEVER